jgi:MFS transporter, ACS family, hexuronate transporter
MPAPAQATEPSVRPIRNLRRWIGALRFASTVINYVDRQSLSPALAIPQTPLPLGEFGHANLLIGFRVACSIGQSVCGRLMDRAGTQRGLTFSVLWFSIVSMPTSLAGGFYSFATFRFVLDAGESANGPGATKAVSEWFPKRERALATALLDSAHRLEERLRPSSYSQSTTVGDGVRRLQFSECWVLFGC